MDNRRKYLQAALLVFGVSRAAFLIRASREPEAHLSLIWLTVWSSVAHGGIMTVQAITDATERGHLLGDVPALFIVALVLAILTPRRAIARRVDGGA